MSEKLDSTRITAAKIVQAQEWLKSQQISLELYTILIQWLERTRNNKDITNSTQVLLDHIFDSLFTNPEAMKFLPGEYVKLDFLKHTFGMIKDGDQIVTRSEDQNNFGNIKNPPMPEWSIAHSIAEMEKVNMHAGIRTMYRAAAERVSEIKKKLNEQNPNGSELPCEDDLHALYELLIGFINGENIQKKDSK